MLELKPITRESIPRALTKAERYRLLNEPFEAESICRDVLAIEPDNQDAIICLLLSLTDLFSEGQPTLEEARSLLENLSGDFNRAYYAGVVEERWAKTLLNSGYPAGAVTGIIRAAMEHFDRAQSLAPAANDDAVLRWNACVRMVERYELIRSDIEAVDHDSLDDDVPLR